MMTGTHSCVVRVLVWMYQVTLKWMYFCMYYRIAVETLWNVLPEMKVEPDEELTERVSGTHPSTSNTQCIIM